MPGRHQIRAAGWSSPHEEPPSTCCHFRTGPAAQLLRRPGVTLPVLRLEVEVEEAGTCNLVERGRTWTSLRVRRTVRRQTLGRCRALRGCLPGQNHEQRAPVVARCAPGPRPRDAPATLLFSLIGAARVLSELSRRSSSRSMPHLQSIARTDARPASHRAQTTFPCGRFFRVRVFVVSSGKCAAQRLGAAGTVRGGEKRARCPELPRRLQRRPQRSTGSHQGARVFFGVRWPTRQSARISRLDLADDKRDEGAAGADLRVRRGCQARQMVDGGGCWVRGWSIGHACMAIERSGAATGRATSIAGAAGAD
jgi:hypothetical protein